MSCSNILKNAVGIVGVIIILSIFWACPNLKIKGKLFLIRISSFEFKSSSFNIACIC